MCASPPYPVLDDAGTLTRLVGVCQDITEQKLAEEQVLQLNAALEGRVAERSRTIETSLRAVEAFNATVSHDLRAPLSVIRLSCAAISQGQGDDLPPRVVESLARIRGGRIWALSEPGQGETFFFEIP